jgi:hypothetical protein
MEQPYAGRAIIENDFSQIRIIIPAKKNWLVIVFIAAWMGGWFFGFISVFGTMFDWNSTHTLNFFMLFWLVGWSVGGLFAFRMLYWMIAGKEIITLEPGRLSIEKKGALFVRPKHFALSEVKNIRVQDDGLGSWPQYRRSNFNMSEGGMIRFDYGFKTVKFATGIDEAEAVYILDLLKAKKLLPNL